MVAMVMVTKRGYVPPVMVGMMMSIALQLFVGEKNEILYVFGVLVFQSKNCTI